MKTFQILLFFCCFTSIGIAQSSGISFSINDSNTGTGLHFNYIKQIKERISFGGGIRIHLNPEIKFKLGIPLDHTFYAKNFNQRLGLNAFFEYQFKIKDWKIDPFIGYHSQVLRTARKVITRPQSEPTLFEGETPLTSWNNMFVLGLNYDLTENLSLKLESALGHSSFYNVDRRALFPDRRPNNDITWQVNVGFNLAVVYWFAQKK